MYALSYQMFPMDLMTFTLLVAGPYIMTNFQFLMREPHCETPTAVPLRHPPAPAGGKYDQLPTHKTLTRGRPTVAREASEVVAAQERRGPEPDLCSRRHAT
jgi:hypothetical protein